MKLIPMTDFVFLMRENKEKDNIRRFWTCEKYAMFLRQPLNLDMFDRYECLFDNYLDFLTDNLLDLESCTVEDMIGYEVTLTPYAIKQLGL